MLCPHCGHDNIGGVDTCAHCGGDLAGLDLPEAAGGFRGHLLSDRIADLELTPAVEVASAASVAQAIVAMRQAGQGCALVLEDGGLVGLFNERHVLTRVLRAGRDPATTAITEVMSGEPLRLSPDDPPAFAVHCMFAYGFRYLPVVEGDEVLGVISVRNILRYVNTLVAA